MKKVLLSAAIIAASISANAQKLITIPYTVNSDIYGMAISENGKFIGGSDIESRAFIYNTETGEIKYYSYGEETGEESFTTDSDIRGVSNDGTGVGYIGEHATKFDFASGKFTYLDESEEGSSLAKYISADGSMISYMAYDDTYVQTPYWVKDGVKHKLQTTTDEWIGYETNGFVVEKGSADGSVLMGYAVDNFATDPLFLWVKNRDEDTYSVVQVSRRYADTSMELNGVQPYDQFAGGAISANGKWVAINWHAKDDYMGGSKIARYDVTTDSITYITCPAQEYTASGISDDGTIVGFAGEMWGRQGFICKAGETEAKSFTEAFPDCEGIADIESGNNTVCDITGDGRYILGFTDETIDDVPCTVTYVIDTQDPTAAIKSATAGSNSSVVASYSVDGKKANVTSRGIMINKMSNGTVKKSIRK